jgi:ATP-dependent Clp protease ATP-binding subunit ClpA
MRVTARALLRGECGYSDPNRPLSFLLMLGETGVGKTETVLSASRFLYGSDDYVMRLDMAEFGEKRTGLARMVGEGRDEQGVIADEMDRVDALWRDRPVGLKRGRILLLDEIEKAHPDVSKLFLGLEAARLRMSNGRLLDFRDTHIFCTSNLGSESAAELDEKVPYAYIKKTVEDEARGHFSSPVFARFTEVIVFRSLKYETQREICRQKLERKLAFLTRKVGQPIRSDPNILDFLVKRGFHRDLGARMMRNAIERELGDAFVAWEHSGSSGSPGLLLRLGLNGLEVMADPNLAGTKQVIPGSDAQTVAPAFSPE